MFCLLHYFCFLIYRLCYCHSWKYMYARLRSILIFICELNYQFSLELSIELSVALSSNVFGEVAKTNWWATPCLIALFIVWWWRRGGANLEAVWSICTPDCWFPKSLWNCRAFLSLFFTIAFFISRQQRKGRRRKWKGHSSRVLLQPVLVFFSPSPQFPLHWNHPSLCPSRDPQWFCVTCSESH